MNTLIASGAPFHIHRAPSSFYLDASSLVNGSTDPLNHPLSGFLVIKRVFSPSSINRLRDLYFSSFGDNSYAFYDNNWHHNYSYPDSHGTGTHPARAFVQSSLFLDFISNSLLHKISSYLLGTSNSLLCPRAIVRSFSHLSKRCTYAHRDCDYFNIPDNSKALTAWIPLGPADYEHGQLIYLENSQHLSEVIAKDVRTDRTLSSDLQSVSEKYNLKWLAPELEIGDVVFHCLNNVHASFDTSNIVPRLSCDLRFSTNKASMDPRWGNSWRGDDGL